MRSGGQYWSKGPPAPGSPYHHRSSYSSPSRGRVYLPPGPAKGPPPPPAGPAKGHHPLRSSGRARSPARAPLPPRSPTKSAGGVLSPRVSFVPGQSPTAGRPHPGSPYPVGILKAGSARPVGSPPPPARGSPKSPPPGSPARSPARLAAGSPKRPARPPMPLHGSPKQASSPVPVVATTGSPLRGVRMMKPAYDSHDVAPEDKGRPSGQEVAVRKLWHGFSPYDHVVSCTMVLDGVNYSMYKGARGGPAGAQLLARGFDDALRDDLISEVGCGVRREDILLRFFPGEIRSVVLHYDAQGGASPPRVRAASGDPPAGAPRLLDAEWSIKAECAMRVRDKARQHHAAIAFYNAVASPEGLCLQQTRRAYRALDPQNADDKKIVVRPPDQAGEGRGAARPLVPLPPPLPVAVSPTRAAVVPAVRLLRSPTAAPAAPPPPQSAAAAAAQPRRSAQATPHPPPPPLPPAASAARAPEESPGRQSGTPGADLRSILDGVRHLERRAAHAAASTPSPSPARPAGAPMSPLDREALEEEDQYRELGRLAGEVSRERRRVRRRLQLIEEQRRRV